MNPLKIAVIGTGSIGVRHLDVLAGMESCNGIAVPLRPGRIKQLRESGYSTARDINDAVRQGITHCIIATDTGRHLEDVLAALELGLQVLVEKPMAGNSTDAKVLQSRSLLLERELYVGCVLRFSESLGIFKQYLQRIGPVHSVRIECQSYLPDWRPNRPYQNSYSARTREGGVLLDLIHEIDYAGWLFGWPKSVQGKLRNLGILGIESEEIAECTWDTPSGCIVSISLDYLSKPAHRKMVAYGHDGTIEWNGILNTVVLSTVNTPDLKFDSAQMRNEMVEAQSVAFINSTQTNHDQKLANSEDGVKALAVCDALRQSSESSKEELVNYS